MRRGRPLAYELTKEKLYEMYIQQQMPISDMSKIFNMPYNSLRNYMVRMGIVLRNAKEAHAIAIAKGRIKGVQLLLTESELRNLYLEQQKSMIEIAEQIGCPISSIQRAFKKWQIPARSVREGVELAYKQGRRERKGKYESNGYIYIYQPNHHRANKAGWVCEHIFIWENAHSKILPEGWLIHHLNGIKHDNCPLNLLAMPKQNHHSAYLIQALRRRIRELEAKFYAPQIKMELD